MKSAISSSPPTGGLCVTPMLPAVLGAEKRPTQPGKRRQNGVTLLELIVTLAIVAMTLTMGVPSLQKFIVSNRVTAQANTLLGALSAARSEAIKRNNLVVVAKTGNDWRDGWLIFVDLDADDTFDNTEPQIQTYDAVNSGYAIRPDASNSFTNRVVYRPDGRGNNGHFDVCSPASDADFRRVTVAPTGRVRVDTPESAGKTYAEACS